MAEKSQLSQFNKKLIFVGQHGNEVTYKMPNQKMITLDVNMVSKLSGDNSKAAVAVSPKIRKKQIAFNNSSIINQDPEDTWSGVRTTQDHEATRRLIEILKSYHIREKFSSKNVLKKKVWVEIAGTLMQEGFKFKNRENAWEKVSQKWRNMERKYRIYINNVNKAKNMGKPIDFFDDLHELLSHKYYVNPDVLATLKHDEEDPHSRTSSMSAENDDDPLATVNVVLADESSYMEGSPRNSPIPSSPELELMNNPIISGTDPVLHVLLEMRDEQRMFHSDMLELQRQQHQEKMDALYALLNAFSQKNGVKRPHNGD